MTSLLFAMFLLATLNCNGLRNSEKRTELFSSLKAKRYDIIVLLETFWDEDIHKKASAEWDGKIYSSMYASQKRRGVTVLFRDTSDCEVTRCITNDNGRYIQLHLTIDERPLSIIGIYAPNIPNERMNFFLNLHCELNKIDNEVIIAGDFNNYLNIYLDKFPSRAHPDPSRKVLNDTMTKHQLVDIWRERNPDKVNFTCIRNTIYGRSSSRIDRILISKGISNCVSHCNITTYPRSDHDFVEISLDLSAQPRGHGYWIFNNSLLHDDEYLSLIRKLIQNEKLCDDVEVNFLLW